MNQLLKIAIAALVLFTGAGLYFANQKLTSVVNDTATLKAQVEVGKKQITAYEKTKAKVESLDYVEALAAKVLPAQQEQSLTVAELSEFALRARLSVSDITFADTANVTSKTTKGKTAIPKGVSVIPVSIKFQPGARYDYLLEFLKSVENNRRKMQITNISLTPDAANRSLLSQVSVDMNLYARSQAASKAEKKQ